MSTTPRVLLSLLLLAAVVGPSLAADAAPKAASSATPCCIPAGDWDEDGIQDRLDKCNNTRKGCIVDQYGCALDADGDGVCDGIDECLDTPKGEKVNKVGCSPSQLVVPPPPAPEVVAPPVTPPPAPAPTPSAVEQQLVETGSIVLRDVYFDVNKATLLPASAAVLDEAGAALAKFGALKVEVQGHTDSRGTTAYNQKLSQARAQTVREYLLSHFSLAADNVTAAGYGESELVVSPENSSDDYAMNRRVVLKALNPEVLPGNVKIEKVSK